MMAQWHIENSIVGFSRTTEFPAPDCDFMPFMPLIHCTVTMRSADMFVGVPADMALYALFTHMLAAIFDCQPGTVCINMADCHVYEENLQQAAAYMENPTCQLPVFNLSHDAWLEMPAPSHYDDPKDFATAAVGWLEHLMPDDLILDGYQAIDIAVTMVP
jgi:hypothetical protein